MKLGCSGKTQILECVDYPHASTDAGTAKPKQDRLPSLSTIVNTHE